MELQSGRNRSTNKKRNHIFIAKRKYRKLPKAVEKHIHFKSLVTNCSNIPLYFSSRSATQQGFKLHTYSKGDQHYLYDVQMAEIC